MTSDSQILCATPSDDCMVLKVVGRGSFQNSFAVKQAVTKAQEIDPRILVIVDLEECVSMDSTFMGVLAGIGLEQRRERHPMLTLVNVHKRAMKLLDTLGLSRFLEVRQSHDEAHATCGCQGRAKESAFTAVDRPTQSRKEQILMMIEAHEDLIHLDNQNRVRFENVLKYLDESLETADR